MHKSIKNQRLIISWWPIRIKSIKHDFKLVADPLCTTAVLKQERKTQAARVGGRYVNIPLCILVKSILMRELVSDLLIFRYA